MAPGTPGASPHTGGEPVVPDAEYLADQARRQFERSQEAQRLQTEQSNDETDTKEAIRRLLGRVQGDRQNISQGANKEGLLFSTTLGKRLDDYQAGVTRQQGDLEVDAQRRRDARAAARAALDQGYSVDEAAAIAASAERQVGRDATDADAGMLVPTPAAAPRRAVTPAAAAAPARRPRPRRTAAAMRPGRPARRPRPRR